MPKLSFRLRMATHYTGFMTVVGLLALLLQAPAPALWIIAGLWLWFAKAFWVYRKDMGFDGRYRSAAGSANTRRTRCRCGFGGSGGSGWPC